MAHVNPQQPEENDMQKRCNSRGIPERFIRGKHVSLQRLGELMHQEISKDSIMRHLLKEIPPYPTPVEFWVSYVAHVTEKARFERIMESEVFRPGRSEYLWWSLKINKEEISAAEKRYKESNFPNEAQELTEKEPFLEKFTTSPLFKLEKSRYGNYRFTFPLTDLMQWYKEQNCGGEEPVLRVCETITYKQEIMYTVLIHSPENNERFGEYPLLKESEWVRYQDGKIIWKAQAICETHQFQFVSGKVKRVKPHKFYVWDQVSLVFHLPKDMKPYTVMKIPKNRLIEALEACRLDMKTCLAHGDKKDHFMEAKMKVIELKRAWRIGIKRKRE